MFYISDIFNIFKISTFIIIIFLLAQTAQVLSY